MSRYGIALAALLCAFPLPTHAGSVTIVRGAPAGFEALAAPRETIIALTYGGRPLGHYYVHYTPSHLMFDAPDDILAAIPTIADRPAVLRGLSRPLSHHAHQICPPGKTVDCGTLAPDDAAVIFNEAMLSAELFINPRLLSITDSSGPRYLPLPARTLSSVVGFSGAVSGTTGGSTHYMLASNSTIAYGEGRFNSQTSLTNEGLRFDTAALGVDRHGWEASAGLFRSRPLQLIADRDIAGISVGTSLRTRLDTRKIAGNDIILYLPRRAIVSVYREGRVYSSRAYEAGNQSIDTTELPEGAYNITLTVQESDGGTREEVRFFAKSPEIPPPDEPTYYAQFGVLRALSSDDSTVPELTGQPIARFGTVQRMDDNLGLIGDFVWLDDRAVVEAGGFLLYGNSQIRATMLASSQRDVGAQFSYLNSSGKWSLATDARALWANENHHARTQPLVQDFLQATGTVSYHATQDITLGARATISRQNDFQRTAYGPYLTWYLWREAENMLSFDTDIGRIDNQVAGNALLRFTMRFGEYGATGTGGYSTGNGGAGALASGRVWHNRITDEEEVLLGANAQYDRTSYGAGVDGHWRNSFGRMRGLLQQSWGKIDSTTSYGANFNFNTAHTEDGFYLGGDRNDISAVVVSLSGNANVPMTIMINGIARGIVAPGDSQTVYLAPYQEYQVRLNPVRSVPIEYDTLARRVTLYPGNVAQMNWEANEVFIVLAQLVDHQGAPISSAWLQEGDGRATTNKKGWLQVQLSDPKRLTFITSDLHACETTLPEAQPVNGILKYSKPLVCDPIPIL